MKASVRSVRIAPKKLNLVASMVRGCTVEKALASLKLTNKKAARILEILIRSALSNAEHNESQQMENLMIKSLVVNKAQAYHRGVPMARGRVRPIRKFLSHADVVLGVKEDKEETKETKEKKGETASQEASKPAHSSKKEREKGTSRVPKAWRDTAASATRSAASKS